MLLGLQFICYLLTAIIVHALPSVIAFEQANDYLIFIAVLGVFCISYTVAYFPNVFRRRIPAYSLYAVFTLFLAYILSFSMHYYDPQMVLTWIILCCAVILSLVIYSMTTKTELDFLYAFFCIFGSVFMFGLIVGFYFREGLWGLFSLCMGTLLFGVYLIYDVKDIIKNTEGRYCLDDYILAAMSLYIDVFGIVISVLKIISNKG